jgi:hypothetical protein
MTYADIQAEDRRSVILQSLHEDSNYSQNDQILKTVLRRLGHNVSDATLGSDLAWLRDAELVSLEWVGDISIATLTRRGADVATGASTVPGIKRPRPAR